MNGQCGSAVTRAKTSLSTAPLSGLGSFVGRRHLGSGGARKEEPSISHCSYLHMYFRDSVLIGV